MSTRSKLGYEFCPVPRKRARAWSTMKHMLGRSLATELYLLNDGKPIEVDGDWRVDLCRQLSVHGRHRGNWCQAMDEAFTLGLLTVSNGCVEIHYQTHTHSTPIEHPLNTKGTPTQHQGNTYQEPSVDNHSTVDLQTDRDRQRIDETDIQRPEGANTGQGVVVVELRQPDAIGYRWLSDTWYQGCGAPDLEKWRDDYAKIGKWSATERADIAANMALTPYLTSKRSKATPGHIVKYREDFASGPRGIDDVFSQKPVAKRSGPAPVSSDEDFAEDRRRVAAGESLW